MKWSTESPIATDAYPLVDDTYDEEALLDPQVSVTCRGDGKRFGKVCRKTLLIPLQAFEDALELSDFCDDAAWLLVGKDTPTPEAVAIKGEDDTVTQIPAGTPLTTLTFACPAHASPLMDEFADKLEQLTEEEADDPTLDTP